MLRRASLAVLLASLVMVAVGRQGYAKTVRLDRTTDLSGETVQLFFSVGKCTLSVTPKDVAIETYLAHLVLRLYYGDKREKAGCDGEADELQFSKDWVRIALHGERGKRIARNDVAYRSFLKEVADNIQSTAAAYGHASFTAETIVKFAYIDAFATSFDLVRSDQPLDPSFTGLVQATPAGVLADALAVDKAHAEALAQFPVVPAAMVGTCSTGHKDPFSGDLMRNCKPGLSYYYDVASKRPHVLALFSKTKHTPAECSRFVQSARGGAPLAARWKGAGQMRPQTSYYWSKGALFKAGWILYKKRPQCHVSVCDREVGKGHLGGPCAISENATEVED